MKFLSLLTIVIILIGCGSQKNEVRYSFFVAGHAYGSIYFPADGLYNKFSQNKPFLDSISTLKFGVLTGDIVQKGTAEEWKAITRDLHTFDIPIYLAPGNHDYKNPELLQKHFPKKYHSFKMNNDLHIVIDATADGWSILGDQLAWLKKTINDNQSVTNIFVYVHQVIWKDTDHPFEHIKVNSTEGLTNPPNFWSDILPLLETINQQVFIFAGDVGGAPWSSSMSYDKSNNLHFFTSGMGSGDNDNFILVNVMESGQARFEFVRF